MCVKKGGEFRRKDFEGLGEGALESLTLFLQGLVLTAELFIFRFHAGDFSLATAPEDPSKQGGEEETDQGDDDDEGEVVQKPVHENFGSELKVGVECFVK